MTAYRTVRVREEAYLDLVRTLKALAPKPPGRPPALSDVLTLALETLRKDRKLKVPPIDATASLKPVVT